jgi:ketosteroid isomerase-like protein
MDAELKGDIAAARTIKALIAQWDIALTSQNLDQLLSGYANDTEIFDIGSQLHGRSQYREQWEKCFPYFGSWVQIERRNIKIFADKNLAFVSCYCRLSGENIPKAEEQPWSRTTVCFQKTADQWQVVHEHSSMAIDFSEGAPALIIGEP